MIGGRMIPKLRGVLSAFDKLKHAVETDAEKLAQRIEGVDARRGAAFAKSNATLDAAEVGIKAIEDFVTELERSNAGPLEGPSLRSSEVAAKG
jgi:hypothetical protein